MQGLVLILTCRSGQTLGKGEDVVQAREYKVKYLT